MAAARQLRKRERIGGAQRDSSSTVEQRGCCGGGGSVSAQRWRELGSSATAAAASAAVAAAQIVAVAHSDSSSVVGGTRRLRRIYQHCPQMHRRTRLLTPRHTNVRVGTSKHLIPTYGPIIDASNKNCKYLQYLRLLAILWPPKIKNLDQNTIPFTLISHLL